METTLTPALGNMLHSITWLAVAVSAISGALEAGKKRFDMFGIIIIAAATALGGGSLRDLLLDRPVFWVHEQTHFLIAIGAALATFVSARRLSIPPRLFLLPDAIGLATFTIAGTLVALTLQAPWLVASFMGVITGVVGGIFRDVLCNEEPLVFQSTLYATAAWAGALILIGLLYNGIDTTPAVLASGGFIFLLRILAIRYNLGLPRFRFKE
ncbi:MAG: trimeric intracellular cation channel family protein [Pseudomonadota bacterium]